MAKKFQEMKLTLQDTLPWIETINEVAQIQKLDIKAAALYVAQELRFYRQFGSIQKQIERASQELTLINMATIRKKQAITVVEDLLNRGVSESQIVQLISFAGEWQKYWSTTTTDGKNNLQQPSKGNNGYGDGNLSQTDQIKLNLIRNVTTNMLNRLGTTP